MKLLSSLLTLSVQQNRCSSNWLPRTVGANDQDVNFYCIATVDDTVLIFGSTKSNELTNNGREYPIVVTSDRANMGFLKGFSFQVL